MAISSTLKIYRVTYELLTLAGQITQHLPRNAPVGLGPSSMPMTIQKHGAVEWPEAWCFYIRGDIATQPGQKVLPDRIDRGELTTYQRGRLTYRCTCGAAFTREPGFNNEEAAGWVAKHRAHLQGSTATPIEGVST